MKIYYEVLGSLSTLLVRIPAEVVTDSDPWPVPLTPDLVSVKGTIKEETVVDRA